MKSLQFSFCLLLVTTLSQAATVISYTATADPNNNPDGTITAGGSGSTNVWTRSTSGTAGSFSGNSADNGDGNGAGAGNPAWGIWSNLGGVSNTVHTFAGGALGPNQLLELDFDNGSVDLGATVGVSLWNASNQNLFEFFFVGGAANYSKNDLGGTVSTSKGYTDDGFKFSFLLNSATTYSADLGGTSLSGSLLNPGSQDITQIRVFTANNNGGAPRDVFFNNLSITSVPEPSRALLFFGGVLFAVTRRRRP